MSSTAILILNWNGSEDTINCLISLQSQLTSEDYLFIIDNGSTDNSIANIESHFNSSKTSFVVSKQNELKNNFKDQINNYLVCNSSNLGFGAGNNVVLEQLSFLKKNFEYVWLLNNDAVATPQTLKSLKFKIQKNETIGAVGSLILNYPNNNTIQCSGVNYFKFFGVSKLINKNRPFSELDKNVEIKFDYLNGASLMFKMKALEKIGYFDERFFLYSEEQDLQIRLQKHKYNLVLDLDSIVYHKLGGGTNKKKHLFYFYYNTSAILLSRKHFSTFYTICAVINLAFITFIRTFPSFKNLKWGIKGILKGLNLN